MKRRRRRTAQLPNGRSKGHHRAEFNPAQLRRGTHVEMEHTTNPRVAQRIAMDHLVEDPNYYKKLAKVHLDGVACSKSSKLARGTVGTLIGGVLGAMIGSAVGVAVVANKGSITAPLETLTLGKNMALIGTGITVTGALIGLGIGVRRPEC